MKDQVVHLGATRITARLGDRNIPEDRYGDFDFDNDAGKSLIRIKTGMSPEMEVDTFFHELVHAVAAHRYLNVPDKQEEKIAQIIGTGLAEILLRNPWITKWVDKKRKKTEE